MIMTRRFVGLRAATIIGCALLLILPAKGQANPAGWQSFIAHAGPQQTGHPYLHLVQAPTPQPSPWRNHVDMTGLAAANQLAAQLKAARFDVNLQQFMNHAAKLGGWIDQVVGRLPGNIGNGSRVLLEHPPGNLPAAALRDRAYRNTSLQIELERSALLIQILVGKAILDFKIATMPVKVSRMLLASSVIPRPLERTVFLDFHQETQLQVYLMLVTGGGPVDTPKGLARKFLKDIGIQDEEIELMVSATIRGTINDWILKYLEVEGPVHLQADRQREISIEGFHRWLTSRDLVIDFPPQESGLIAITHPDVVAFSSYLPYVALFAQDGIRAVGVQPGTAIVTVEMANAHKDLTDGRARLTIRVADPNGPPQPLSPRPPLPDPNAFPRPNPTPGPAPSNPPGGPQAPSASPAPSAKNGEDDQCNWWNQGTLTDTTTRNPATGKCNWVK
jgi:hypothetical protein